MTSSTSAITDQENALKALLRKSAALMLQVPENTLSEDAVSVKQDRLSSDSHAVEIKLPASVARSMQELMEGTAKNLVLPVDATNCRRRRSGSRPDAPYTVSQTLPGSRTAEYIESISRINHALEGKGRQDRLARLIRTAESLRRIESEQSISKPFARARLVPGVGGVEFDELKTQLVLIGADESLMHKLNALSPDSAETERREMITQVARIEERAVVVTLTDRNIDQLIPVIEQTIGVMPAVPQAGHVSAQSARGNAGADRQGPQ